MKKFVVHNLIDLDVLHMININFCAEIVRNVREIKLWRELKEW